ncbi:hypothetical protein VTO42DRAFT_7361 [Malbranchea cinnamomea]
MSVMDVLDHPSNPVLQNAAQPQLFPYASSISSSASSSTSSIFSADALSFQSSASSVTLSSIDLGSESGCRTKLSSLGLDGNNNQCSQATRAHVINPPEAPLPAELRQNPRRTCNAVANGLASGIACTRPPQLVRQCERKDTFVDNLVDSASQIVETIWPLSVVSRDSTGNRGVLPLRIFIQETLRRSRTSYSTLQVALYYLILIKNCVPKMNFTTEQPRDSTYPRAMQCGRRMFLAALILASKYLQDRNYSARAWSKISGLSTAEINQNEWAFLEAVNWKLHISEPVFQRWTDIVLKYTPRPGDSSNGEGLRWAEIIPKLTPELNTIELNGGPLFNSLRCDFFFSNGALSACPPSLSDRPSPAFSHNDQRAPTYHRDVPSALEPTPRMNYPNVTLPSLPKLGLLPTPQMTPQANVSRTPTVGVSGFGSTRPSIGAVLSQAQSRSIQHATLDRRPSVCLSRKESFDSSRSGRRSSLARSASSSSSPESMVSDVPSVTSSQSTRSSRSSSISSVTSVSCAPVRPRLARRATRQCMRSYPSCLKESRKTLSIATPINELDSPNICTSPEQFVSTSFNIPDLTNFSLKSSDNLSEAHEAARGLCELSGAFPRPTLARSHSSLSSISMSSGSELMSPGQQSRKRGRTDSMDACLQHTVRHLMSAEGRRLEDDGNVVIPDKHVAESFLLPQPHASSFRPTLPTHQSLPARPGSLIRGCGGQDAAKFLWGLQNGVTFSSDTINVLD